MELGWNWDGQTYTESNYRNKGEMRLGTPKVDQFNRFNILLQVAKAPGMDPQHLWQLQKLPTTRLRILSYPSCFVPPCALTLPAVLIYFRPNKVWLYQVLLPHWRSSLIVHSSRCIIIALQEKGVSQFVSDVCHASYLTLDPAHFSIFCELKPYT